MEGETIYRVRRRWTNSLQPGGDWNTTWDDEILYCGTDRTAARVAYHTSAPHDYSRGHGNSCRETLMEEIEDTGTDDAADDPVEVVEAD
jgi:hypothetical protein